MAQLRKKSTLIPRWDYPMTTRNVNVSVATPDDPFANSTTSYTFIRGAALACSIQNMSSWDINNLPEGIKTKQVFRMFSNTPLYSSIEGTDRMSDSIYLPDSFFSLNDTTAPVGVGGWYNVIKPYYRNVGVVVHCECVIFKDDNPLNTDGLSQFPSTVNLDPLIDTKTKLQDSTGWLPTWEGENV